MRIFISLNQFFLEKIIVALATRLVLSGTLTRTHIKTIIIIVKIFYVLLVPKYTNFIVMKIIHCISRTKKTVIVYDVDKGNHRIGLKRENCIPLSRQNLNGVCIVSLI